MARLETSTIDSWADDLRGPVALFMRETLLPLEGRGGVIFPPTYAGDNRKFGPYAIDEVGADKVVQVDSVGSQANRMEPLFRQSDDVLNPLAELVPQVDIVLPDGSTVSILEVGHRLGDAFVRSSALRDEAVKAFAALSNDGDAGPIGKLAPTSLVFGAWDSRGEGAKLPRIVQSVIRAWKIEPLKRSAQYNPPIDYSKFAVFDESEKAKAEGNTKSPLAQRGFVHVPAVDTHGGVVVNGPIYRDVTINLVALRQIGAKERSRELRRYILGLSLVAASEPLDGFLRQGCLITIDPDAPSRWEAVQRTGRRDVIELTPESALAYARTAASAYGVGANRKVQFSPENAKADAKAKKA